MAKHKLTQAAKTLVITRHAQFARLAEIQTELREVFDIDVNLSTIDGYNPNHPKFSKKYQPIFDEARKQFNENLKTIPIANKSFRLATLDKLLTRQLKRAEASQNPVEIRATLEQAAKEADGVTTKVEMTGKDGKELPATPQVVVYLPDNGRGDPADGE